MLDQPIVDLHSRPQITLETSRLNLHAPHLRRHRLQHAPAEPSDSAGSRHRLPIFGAGPQRGRQPLQHRVQADTDRTLFKASVGQAVGEVFSCRVQSPGSGVRGPRGVQCSIFGGGIQNPKSISLVAYSAVALRFFPYVPSCLPKYGRRIHRNIGPPNRAMKMPTGRMPVS